MFYLNDHHVNDSSFVPKMAVVHNLPSCWYSLRSSAQILLPVPGNSKLRGRGVGVYSANGNDNLL